MGARGSNRNMMMSRQPAYRAPNMGGYYSSGDIYSSGGVGYGHKQPQTFGWRDVRGGQESVLFGSGEGALMARSHSSDESMGYKPRGPVLYPVRASDYRLPPAPLHHPQSYSQQSMYGAVHPSQMYGAQYHTPSSEGYPTPFYEPYYPAASYISHPSGPMAPHPQDAQFNSQFNSMTLSESVHSPPPTTATTGTPVTPVTVDPEALPPAEQPPQPPTDTPHPRVPPPMPPMYPAHSYQQMAGFPQQAYYGGRVSPASNYAMSPARAAASRGMGSRRYSYDGSGGISGMMMNYPSNPNNPNYGGRGR